MTTTYQYQTIDPPGSGSSGAGAINSRGQIIGSYEDSSGEHDFLYSNGVYTTINAPGSTETVLDGINSKGQIIGQSDGPDQSFRYSGGTYAKIDFPPGSTNTGVAWINDKGQVLGGYRDGSGDHGFVYSHGSYTTINVPGAVNTDVVSINNAGDIDGTYQDSANGPHYGFLYSHGAYTTIAPPGSQNTHVSGTINSSGEIVGSFTTTSGGESGFIYDHGTYTILNEPGAVSTAATNINDKGQVIGTYLTGSDGQVTGQGSFIYSDGKFTTIPPETGGPTANDINNKGQIVGTYTGADGNTRGFLTQDKGQALVGAHDSFVFAPNLGTSVHSNMREETIDHPKSEFADFAALLAQAHGDGAHQTVHDATDFMDHAATLAAQHAHHFLV